MLLANGIIPTPLTGLLAERPTILSPFCLNGWLRSAVTAAHSPMSCDESANVPSLNVRERNENDTGRQAYIAGKGQYDFSFINKGIQHPSWFKRRRT